MQLAGSDHAERGARVNHKIGFQGRNVIDVLQYGNQEQVIARSSGTGVSFIRAGRAISV
jgi:hypothetical protein